MKRKRTKMDSVDRLRAGLPLLTVVQFTHKGGGDSNEFAMLTEDQAKHCAAMLETAKNRKNIDGYNVFFAIDGVVKNGKRYTAGVQRWVSGFEHRRAQAKRERIQKMVATKSAKAKAAKAGA